MRLRTKIPGAFGIVVMAALSVGVGRLAVRTATPLNFAVLKTPERVERGKYIFEVKRSEIGLIHIRRSLAQVFEEGRKI